MKKIEIIGENYFGKWDKVRKASRAIIIDNDKILLSYEKNTKIWMLPGGGMEEGEDEVSCCIREIEEETGYIINTSKCVLEIDELYENWNYISSYFLGTIIKNGNRNLTEQETKAHLIPKWISLKKAFNIFSKYESLKDKDEMISGLYLREYTALKNTVPLKKGEIISFDVITLKETGMRYVSEYELISKDGNVEVSQYMINFSDEKDNRTLIKRKECDNKQVIELINNCNILSWDGFFGKHPKDVRDGIMFNFNAIVNGNKSVTASGSQNFPKHYRIFTQWISDILNK